MFDKINDLFLNQLVHEPTRFRKGEKENCLDWVITNNIDIIQNVRVEAALGEHGDHGIIRFEIDASIQEPIPETGYCYYRGNYEEMKNELIEINWPDKLDNLNTQQAWNSFQGLLEGMIENYIPKKKFTLRKKKPWINREVITAIKNKRKAWDRYKKKKTAENWDKYAEIRNRTNRTINKAKFDYEQKITTEIKSNPKQFWKYINAKSNRKRDLVDLVDEAGNLVTDEKDKAELLNNYFSSVYTKEDVSNIPNIENRANEQSIESTEITQDIVNKQLAKLNISKAAGPDGLHARVLKELKDEITVPLTIIYHKSLIEGMVPSQWREAYIKPIFKKGKRNSPSNYRPVSLTAICCKMLERIIRSDIVKHLEGLGLLSIDQHGFREGRSCCTQLLEVMEIWTSLFDKGLPWDTLYMDFSKAFDKVPHRRLVHKLEAYGISGSVLRWIEGFLTDRRQAVSLNDSKSKWLPVTSGIPQGSVLGPVLFIIYINDLPDVVSSNVKLFADDTKIFRAIQTAQDNLALQDDINRLVEWADTWKMPFNTTKCKVVHYGKGNLKHKYQMADHELIQENEEKDLGVTFDQDLKFSKHIRNMTARANSRVGLLKHNFEHLDIKNFLPLYKSQVRPLLEYCSSVWDPIYKGDALEIEKVQHRATKLVPCLKDLPYPERLKKLKINTLAFRRKRSDIIQVFRILKGVDKVEPNAFFTRYNLENTRGHTLKLAKPRNKTNIRQHSFSNRIINTWNKLPQYAIDCKTINSFKTALNRAWANDRLKYEIPPDFSPILLK